MDTRTPRPIGPWTDRLRVDRDPSGGPVTAGRLGEAETEIVVPVVRRVPVAHRRADVPRFEALHPYSAPPAPSGRPKPLPAPLCCSTSRPESRAGLLALSSVEQGRGEDALAQRMGVGLAGVADPALHPRVDVRPEVGEELAGEVADRDARAAIQGGQQVVAGEEYGRLRREGRSGVDDPVQQGQLPGVLDPPPQLLLTGVRDRWWESSAPRPSSGRRYSVAPSPGSVPLPGGRLCPAGRRRSRR